jgi:hypothetical protein
LGFHRFHSSLYLALFHRMPLWARPLRYMNFGLSPGPYIHSLTNSLLFYFSFSSPLLSLILISYLIFQ